MFQGFTKSTSDFMWELMFNNERSWFQAHKEEFEEKVNRPFKALAADTLAVMEQRHPKLEYSLHISRIYRDARRLFGRGPYKEHLWFSIDYGTARWNRGPSFWFEVGAADYSFGLGFFDATASEMETFRRTVDANPARFERLAKNADKLKGFRIIGEEYKRPRGDKGKIINKWYNRKRLGIECSRDFGEELYDTALPQKLADAYDKLMPLYDFFLECFLAECEENKLEEKL